MKVCDSICREMTERLLGAGMKAGFDRLYSFHSIRYTSVNSVYRLSHDLFLAQRFARHVSPLTTTVYTSDQDAWERVRGLTC